MEIKTRSGKGRMVYAILFLAISLLAVFRAPTYHLWMISIIVTEWGHMLAVLALLPFAPGWSTTKGGRMSVVIAVVSSFLFLTPLLRSQDVAANLQRLLDARVTQKSSLSKQQADSMRVLVIGESRSNSLLVTGRSDRSGLRTTTFRNAFEDTPVLGAFSLQTTDESG
jgi:glucan phosphoethanolaminetransferase (alkaline phosphatase superfamily)